jgi:hypothetical protein
VLFVLRRSLQSFVSPTPSRDTLAWYVPMRLSAVSYFMHWPIFSSNCKRQESGYESLHRTVKPHRIGAQPNKSRTSAGVDQAETDRYWNAIVGNGGEERAVGTSFTAVARDANFSCDYFRVAKNNRSKSVWTLFQRKRLSNQIVWPVIFGLTGPICARALKSLHLLELRPRGHHDLAS